MKIFRTVQLEYQLEKKYGLEDVVVVSTSELTPEMVKKGKLDELAVIIFPKSLKDVKTNRYFMGIYFGGTGKGVSR
ncbi:hypothetical protein GCM10020331_013400 [Ectobacillus funiculus]